MATDGLPETNSGGEQQINLPRLDSLNVADVQVGKFRQPLLADPSGRPFAAEITAQLLEPGRASLGFRHAPFVGKIPVDGYGACMCLAPARGWE